MRHIALLCLFVCLVFSTGNLTAQENVVPRFEVSECPSDTFGALLPECGILIVPEDRTDPDSETIRLAVAIFRSTAENPAPDPLIYLAGGPGGQVIISAGRILESGFATFLSERDVIFFDQRGAGYSQPELFCSEIGRLYRNDADGIVTRDDEIGAYKDCYQRFIDSGVTLTAYNNVQNAADVRDLVLTLGYQQANFYGVSYGTRLGLTVMRDYPEIVRSAILDSVYPHQVDGLADRAPNYTRALNELFTECAADQACNAAYPDLETQFYDTVERLNQNPVTVEVGGSGGYPLMLDGTAYLWNVFELFYASDIIPYLPRMMAEAAEGDFMLFGQLRVRRDRQITPVAFGMFYSVQCSTEYTFSTAEGVAAAGEGTHPLIDMIAQQSFTYEQEVCTFWHPFDPDPLENQAVSSDAPVLLFGGQYDPITPPDYAQLAAQTLPNGTALEFRGAGHGVLRMENDCWLQVVTPFLSDPSAPLETACVEQLPRPRFG